LDLPFPRERDRRLSTRRAHKLFLSLKMRISAEAVEKVAEIACNHLPRSRHTVHV